MVKSLALLFVSVAPPPFRCAEVVLDSAAVGDVSRAVGCPVADEIDDRRAGRACAGERGGARDERDLAGRRRSSRSCRWRPGSGAASSLRARRPPGSR